MDGFILHGLRLDGRAFVCKISALVATFAGVMAPGCIAIVGSGCSPMLVIPCSLCQARLAACLCSSRGLCLPPWWAAGLVDFRVYALMSFVAATLTALLFKGV